MVAPSMDRGAAASGVQSFAGLDNMYVSQTRKGCIKECFGCEQNSEARPPPRPRSCARARRDFRRCQRGA